MKIAKLNEFDLLNIYQEVSGKRFIWNFCNFLPTPENV